MPIIDHSQAPEVPWRPGYRKWDVTGREHRAKAVALLEESLAISSELGMRPLLERVLSRREILQA